MLTLLNKLKIYVRYLWQHGIEMLGSGNYLFNTRVEHSPAAQDIVLKHDGASGGTIDFQLIDTLESAREFNVVEQKFMRMDHPQWRCETNPDCLVCGAAVKPVIEVTGLPGTPSLELGWCPACDYLQYSSRPPKDWFADWYKNSFDPVGNLDQNLATRPFTQRYFKRLQPFIGDRKIRVLDLGAGYGEKTMAFQKAGHQLFCIEPSQARADYLKSVGCTVICGVLGDPEVDEFMQEHGPFDLVFTYHAIEHVAGRIEDFERLTQHLGDGGMFYLAIPELYKEGLMNNVFTLDHLNNFSRTAAIRFLNRLGFAVERAADDVFQYYTNYCQYLVGRKVSKTPVSWEAENVDPDRYLRYVRQQLDLDRLSPEGGVVRFTLFGHAPLTYSYGSDTLRAVRASSTLPRVRFRHAGRPLFWPSSY